MARDVIFCNESDPLDARFVVVCRCFELLDLRFGLDSNARVEERLSDGAEGL